MHFKKKAKETDGFLPLNFHYSSFTRSQMATCTGQCSPLLDLQLKTQNVLMSNQSRETKMLDVSYKTLIETHVSLQKRDVMC